MRQGRIWFWESCRVWIRRSGLESMMAFVRQYKDSRITSIEYLLVVPSTNWIHLRKAVLCTNYVW